MKIGCIRGTCCLILMFFVMGCSSHGLIYRTGCCPRPQAVPDVAKRTIDFIESYGYMGEIHEIVTEDWYVLSLHRIRSDEFGDAVKPPIIIQHGIASSSPIWFMNGKNSFPFLLAREGFDVWLLDTRGNSYSRKNIFLSTTDPRFWRFSFHEQGIFDLAAATDYVLNTTNNEKLFYVGHSRGTTMALALLSTRPEYNNKFKLATLFAPVAYIRHIGNPIRILYIDSVFPTIKSVVKAFGAYIVPGSSESSIQFREIICNRTESACINLIFSFSGYDYELLNKSMIPTYLAHYPEGGSVQEFLHYLQIGITDEFRQFDYGSEMNIKIYSSPKPPLYDLSKVTAPIAVHHAENDLFVRPQDFKHLMQQLVNVVADVRVPFKKFTHMDFVWATKADIYVYKPSIEIMKRYINS